MKKIWKELLTSGFISGFAVYFFDKIFGGKIQWDKLNNIPILEWLNMSIPLYKVFLFTLILLVIYGIISIIRKTFLANNSIYKKKQEELLKQNSLVMGDVLWKWQPFFDHGGNPNIGSYLKPYCNRHNPPMLMSHNSFHASGYTCPLCENEVSTSVYHKPNYESFKLVLQSLLEDKWGKINK